MEPTVLATREYLGHHIELRTSDLTFRVSGPEFIEEAHIFYHSLHEAQAAVAKRVEDSEKLAAANCNFSIALYDANGIRHQITKINRRTGNLILNSSRYLYPELSWIALALIRIKVLQCEANEIEEKLSEFKIANSRAYSQINVEDYPSKVQTLLKTVKEKTEAAKASQYSAITTSESS